MVNMTDLISVGFDDKNNRISISFNINPKIQTMATKWPLGLKKYENFR